MTDAQLLARGYDLARAWRGGPLLPGRPSGSHPLVQAGLLHGAKWGDMLHVRESADPDRSWKAMRDQTRPVGHRGRPARGSVVICGCGCGRSYTVGVEGGPRYLADHRAQAVRAQRTQWMRASRASLRAALQAGRRTRRERPTPPPEEAA